MKRVIKIILFLTIISNLLFAKDLEKVSIQLQWLDQFQFAGYYIAKEKGFYEEVGLDVNILKYSNDINVLLNVVSGKATYATGRTSLLIHKNKGYPIVATAAIFQHSPSVLIVTDEKILTPHDLVNRKVMISSDAITSASYMSMLFSEGISADDLVIQQHSFNLDDLINGETDAMASYISNEPYRLEKRGIPYKAFHPKDYGFDFYGDILYTSQQELTNNPLRAQNFTKASLKGWDYAFKNIEETAKLIFEKYNTQNKTIDELIFEGKSLKNLALDEKGEIGHISEEKFKDIAKTYRLLGLIDKDYSLDGFIRDFHCTEDLDFTDEEQRWLLNKKFLRVGTNKLWNPIEFFDESNNYSGIASGYKKLLEEKLGVKLILEKDNYWHEMIDKIKNDEVDIFLAIVNTPNRREYMNFTSSYLEFPTVIVTKDEVGYIRDTDELTNKKIVVEKSFYTNELITYYNNEIDLITVNTTSEALKKVYEDEAFAYIGALPNIGYFIKELKYTNLKINGDIPFETKLGFSSRKSMPQLQSILQKALDSITKEEHDEIYNKWINIKYQKEEMVDYRPFIIVGIVLALIFIILYIRNTALEKEIRIKEIFTNKLSKLNRKLAQKNETLKRISEIDTLTKLANRRKIDKFLEIEFDRISRNNLDLSIIMIDIDFFKRVNDTYGHKAGDIVLVELSRVLKNNIRKYDLVGRWGGEEFIIVSPNNNLQKSILLCKKLKKIISELKLVAINQETITASFGVAQYIEEETIDELLMRADKELYNAKNNGRNTIYPLL